MVAGKHEIRLLITFIAYMAATPAMAIEAENIRYTFTLTDSTLTFYGSFRTNSSPDCLLELFLNYNHIKALAPDGMEVQLADQGNDWNLIRYKFQKLILFENISEWHRKLDRGNQIVDIKLVSSENNRGAMPEMIISSGYYRVREEGGDIIVEYHQHCQLTRTFITGLILKILKNEAIEFLQKLFEYTNANCTDIPVR